MKKVVIIGGVAAGMSAAAKLQRRDPTIELTVFEQGRYVSYGACGLPYFLAGDIPQASQLIARTEEEFIEDGINLLTKRKVLAVKPASRLVDVLNLNTDHQEQYAYDQLIMATGAEAIIPPLSGSELSNIRVLRTLDDGIAIKRILQDPSCRQVIVVGGGYIGVEIAECLARRGQQITVIEMEERILNNFGQGMSELALACLKEKGVTIRTGEKVQAFNGQVKVKEVITDRASYPADLVIVAVGVKPRSTLAEAAGLKTGVKGAIKVDRYLRTSQPEIYAAGDCAETYHQLLGCNSYLPLGTVANKQGRLLGENLYSADQKPFSGAAGTSITRVFELGLARTGLSEEEAIREGYRVDSIFARVSDRAAYMPGTEPMHVSLIYTLNEGRILGAQVAGRGDVAKRIDIAVLAIMQRMTVQDLSRGDFAYSPPFAPVWDPFLIAARLAQK